MATADIRRIHACSGSCGSPATNCVSVRLPCARLIAISRGATHSQLTRNPESVAGKSQTADSPHA
jgi:hypothetical protein